jgi:hypothetical protein
LTESEKTEEVYRIVPDDGPDRDFLIRTTTVYGSQSVAELVRNNLNEDAEFYGLRARYKLQRGRVVWEEVPE